jgi:hypothetical protein
MKKMYLLFAVIIVTFYGTWAADLKGWSGDFNPGGWENVLDIDLPPVEVGDEIQFIGTAYDNAQIQIANNNWREYLMDGSNNYLGFDGKLSITVTQDNQSFFNDVIHVKGQNYTLTSVVVHRSDAGGGANGTNDEEYGDIPWTGSFDASHWTYSLSLKVPEAAVGGAIVVRGEVWDNAQIQMANKDYTSFPGGAYQSFNGYMKYVVTDDNLAIVREGFHLKGQNFKLTSVTYEVPEAVGGFQLMPWTGNFEANNWNSELAVKAPEAKVGQLLAVKGDVGMNAQIQLAATDRSFYLDGDYKSFSGYLKLAITADNVDAIQSGIYIKGQNFVITSVTITDGVTGTGGENGEDTGATSGSGTDEGQSAAGFMVSGTRLLDAKGNDFVMRGVNFSWAWQWQNDGPNTATNVIAAAKRQGCNSIRIQLGDGQADFCTKPTAAQLSELISICERNRLVAIFNTHDETGSDDYAKLEKAADFWISMKDILNNHRSTVIVNISNEWYGTWNAQGWADGYKRVIPRLRDAGLLNTLMVDCAGYGQYPQSIAEKGAEVAAADTQHNLLFSIHMYEYAAADEPTVQRNIDNALNIGVPVVIGEYGYSREGKTIAWQAIQDYCQQKGVGYLGWSWTGNGGGDASLDMFAGYDDSSMLENGRCIILGQNGIRATSKECKVFDGFECVVDSIADSDLGNNEGGNDAPVVPSVTNGEEVIWSGSFPITWTGNGLKVLGYRFADARQGDQLVFTITDTLSTADASAQLQIGSSGYVAMVESEPGQGCVDVVGGSYTLVLSQAMVDKLINGSQDGGLRIKGQNCTLTSIVLKTAAETYGYAPVDVATFSPARDMGMWNDNAIVKVDKLMFSDLSVGDRLVFNLQETNPVEDAQLQIASMLTWTYLRDGFKNAGVQAPAFFFSVTADEAALLQQEGLAVKGTKCALSSIQIWKRGTAVAAAKPAAMTTAIEGVESPAFDDQKPYDIYTVDGQRCREFSGRRRMYILHQGTQVVKVVK